MFQESVCPECQKELTGAIEVFTFSFGRLNLVVMQETRNRNWIDCDICGKAICKSCCIFPASGYCNWCFFKKEVEPLLSVKLTQPTGKNSAENGNVQTSNQNQQKQNQQKQN